LAVANGGSDNVSVLLGDGSGGFSAQTTFAVGDRPLSVTVGDFNGDKNQDLAVANFGSANVSVLLGDGSGGFSAQTTFAVGANPLFVTVGDFNNDNNQDLAVANGGSDNVSVLLGDGSGGFSAQTTFAVGANPVSVTVGDFNGDEKQDLAVANRFSDNVSVLLRDGSGGFSAQTTFAVGDDPQSVTVGDFNGDKKQDLAVTNVSDDNVSVLLGDGSGGFSTQTTFAAGGDSFSVTVGDFNGDGKQDLAVTNVSDDNVSVLLGDGSGGFSTQTTFAAGRYSFSVTVGDFDGDGKQDLAVANGGNNNVSVLLNNPPKITSVTATTANGSYKAGDTIAITVTFDAAVTVDTTGGTPRLQLETGTTDQYATYDSGNGGNILTFNYVVQVGDSSADLEYFSTTALELNGGTIKDNLTVDAILTLPALGSDNSLGGSKAIVIDTVAPTLTPVTIASNNANTALAKVGDAVTVAFTASETLGGTPTVTIGGQTATVTNSGNNYTATYTLQAADTEGNLPINITFTNAAGNAGTAVTATTNSSSVTFDKTAPTVALTSTAATPVNGLFTVTATFSENVTGFDISDITVGNGTASNFMAVNATTYTFDVTPAADGSVTVDVAASSATDSAGNNNIAATQLTRTADINDIPTLSDITKTGLEDTDITFAATDFTDKFSDLEKDSLSKIKITSLPDNGTLKLNGTAVTAAQEINAADLGKLTFTPNADFNGNVSFTWNGSDGKTYAVAAAKVDLIISNVDEPPVDEPPVNSGLFTVSPSQVLPFTGLSSILPSESSNNSQNNTTLPEPSAIPPEPTIDLVNISFTAVGADSADNIDGTPNDDVISGQSGNDVIRGLPGRDALFGNDGDDEIYGNQGADLLLGNQGKDIIYGGQGNDLAMGGQNDDLIYGDLGSDTLIGDLGDDKLFGGSSSPGSVASDAGDLLFGKDGNDFLHGHAGDDSIYGGNDNDTARGGQGDDLIHGDAGADILYGDKGNDSLTGNADNDVVYGGEGNDFLWGGDGEDFLYGDEGDDTLIGNADKDYFVLQSGFSSDTILDFTNGIDLIGLAGGLTFDQLSITGSNGNTLIARGNELLATLTGVDVSLIDSADFTLMV